MSTEGELRATSDMMLQILDRLRDWEVRKRDLVPGTREFAKAAFDVMELSRTATRWSELQLRQANEALSAGPDGYSTTVADSPRRRLDEVLAEWRRAEIELSQARPGSMEAAAAATTAERLKLEYRTLQDEKHRER